MENQLEQSLLEEDESRECNGIPFNGPSYLIAEKLKEKGYDISGHGGVRLKEKTLSSFIGILKDRKPVEKRILGFKYNKKQRALHLGTLWFNNNKKDADENKNWVLEVYGKKYLPTLTKLVNSLSKPYNVQVEVKLKNEYPLEETYLSDLAK